MNDEAYKAFWWAGKPNFGDRLTPLLLKRFAGIDVVHAEPADADIVAVGSVLEAFGPEWSGTVLGSGKMYEKTEVNLPRANIMALRGPLTAAGVPGDYVLGDPGLLANELVRVDKAYELGIVPHWSDDELEHRPEFQRYNPRIISPFDDPLAVVSEIGRCHKLISSSLHGVIVAHAFGIPVRTEIAPRLRNEEGGVFKFMDHCAALRLPFKVGAVQTASDWRVQDLQHGLWDVLESLRV